MSFFYRTIKIMGFAICFLFSSLSFAQNIETKGFADTYHSMRLKSPNDYLISRNRLRMELTWDDMDKTFLYVSFNLIKNNMDKSNDGFEFREAYINYSEDDWELKVGRQLIIWGKADGLRITDIINPTDYSEFLARDFDDIRIPVDALRFKFLGSDWEMEFVWLPLFQKNKFAPEESPWNTSKSRENLETRYKKALGTEKKIGNSEFAFKFTRFFSGIDFSLSYFHTRDDNPVLVKSFVLDKTYITPEYKTMDFVGAEFSASKGEFVFRGETAFYIGKYFNSKKLKYTIKKNMFNWLAGADWYPGNDWTLSAQITDSFIMNYDSKIETEEHKYISTLNISKKLLRSTLTITNLLYYDISENGTFNRLSADYALSDEFHLIGGFDVFTGSKGMFGSFSDNSQVWIKAKYSF